MEKKFPPHILNWGILIAGTHLSLYTLLTVEFEVNAATLLLSFVVCNNLHWKSSILFCSSKQTICNCQKVKLS